MLPLINRIYFLSIIFLYFVLFFKVTEDFKLILIFATLNAIAYFLVLQYHTLRPHQIYNRKNIRDDLIIKVLIYSLIAVTIEDFISYYYRNNFFLFSEADAVFYHGSTIEIIDMTFFKGISYYLSFMGFDDLGIILVLYPLYHIFPSNLTLNIFYIVMGILSALSIFNISQYIMSRKYAYLTALAYCTSSFVLYFHGTGLKESFMVSLIIFSFNFYFKFLYSSKGIYLILSLLFAIWIMLFRPILTVMIIGSIGIGTLFGKKTGTGVKIFAFILFIALMLFGGFISQQINSYTTGGVDSLIHARETQGGIIGGVAFTYSVNVLSQLIGPLPTVISMSKVGTMFYTAGLIYRVLLAFPFWLGVLYVIKTRSERLYPLIIFTIIEMSALAYLIDGLELRKAMPHMPYVFIVAFWFLDKYDNKLIRFKSDSSFKQLFWGAMIVLVGLMCYWNFR